jgi:hypothetical protein
MIAELGRRMFKYHRTRALESQRGKGLQNLYSSVRSRPAPPTYLFNSSTIYATLRFASTRSFSRRSTVKNGEDSAKRGSPSEFVRPLVGFRPTLAEAA